MSVHDADVGDIYVDANGKLWRVTGLYREPTVEVTAVEPHGAIGIHKDGEIYHEGDPPNGVQFLRERQFGGVSGIMWEGFKRVWRRENP